MCVCAREWVCESERDQTLHRVLRVTEKRASERKRSERVRDREREEERERARESESEREKVCMCVCEGERQRGRERDRERERVCERERDQTALRAASHGGVRVGDGGGGHVAFISSLVDILLLHD